MKRGFKGHCKGKERVTKDPEESASSSLILQMISNPMPGKQIDNGRMVPGMSGTGTMAIEESYATGKKGKLGRQGKRQRTQGWRKG